YMDRYMANKPNFIQGHLPVSRSVAEGTNAATLDATSSAWPFKRTGQVEVAFSEVDETPVFTLTGSIFKDAPHPNAARLYLSWFLAKEQQSRLGTFSPPTDVPPPHAFRPRRMVPPPEGCGPFTSYKIANAYREFMLDEKLIADLRKRMEGYIGPIVNQGGVR